MGVQGLWELLAPVGRRVSVETLSGKKVAIDASIWIVQFMKAMRDEGGEMVRNAHILGFFRRICKLLFLRTKPVFVFDGGTPALKRRTVIARRRQRENAQVKIRKTAEKLLLNHLKAMRLKELAKDIENQKKENKSKGKNIVSESTEVNEDDSKRNDKATSGYDQETLDELLAVSLAAEEDGSVTGNASTSVGGIAFEGDDGDDDEEMILPVMHGKVDPSVLAALPPSMQLDLLVQMRERLMAENRQKYQKVNKAPAKFSELQIQAYLKTVAFRREIDEVQKSAAGRGVGGVQTSRIASEANREYIFSSSFTGDKQILTSAGVENNGEVEGRTLGKEPISSAPVNHISSTAQSSPVPGSGMDAPSSGLEDDVETYLDEKGRLRLSRVRAMGIRMTRDLQRNLDLMKEIEQEKMKKKTSTDLEAIFNKKVFGGPESFPVTDHVLEASDVGNDEIISLKDGMDTLVQCENHEAHENKTTMEISFFEDDNGHRGTDGDDDLFAHLVAGNSVNISCAKTTPSGHSFASASDCSWEEGIVQEKGASFSNDEEESQKSLAKGNIMYENEVDWEEGVCNVPRNSSTCPTMHNQTISMGSLEEEADIQEAIRRSLEDITKDKSIISSTEKKNIKISSKMGDQGTRGLTFQTLNLEKDRVALRNLPIENELVHSQASSEAVAGDAKLDYAERSILQINDTPINQLGLSIELEVKTDEKSTLMHRPCQRDPVSSVGVLSEEVSECRSVQMETPCGDLVTPVEPERVRLIAGQCLDTSTEHGEGVSFAVSKCSSKISSHVSAAVMDDVPEVIRDAHRNEFEAAPTCHSYETIENANSQEQSSTKELTTDFDKMQDQVAEKNSGVRADEVGHTRDNSAIQDNMEVQMELSEASLDEEMLFLRQERLNLGDEQRKLERNAESVTSEMFAECQELLQMFGLPYIIAPMEAEAQCAYMELANLVDGVVTDDSDVFLFGARSVYKNIFDDRKYVETYFMKDIESELGLTREQLIRMALLLGSDYTEGVSGIGIVNAIEVVHAFPEEDGLQKFREWLESPDPTILGKLGAQTGCSSRKRGSKVSNDDANCSKNNMEGGFGADGNVSQGHDDKQSVDNTQSIKKIFMDKHRNVSKNWHIPSSFPSERVISAYVSPQVDNSTESFSWGKPDLFVLHKLCWEKFGWSNQKADELLLPVLKEYNKHETQLRLEAFYTFNERFAKIRSRRITKAVKGITGNHSAEFMDLPQEASKARKKVRAGPTGSEENRSDYFPNGEKNDIAENTSNSEKSTPRKSRRRTESEPMLTEVGHSEPPIGKEHKRNTRKGLSRNVRGKGRGRGSRVGRGKGKEAPCSELTETSSDDGRNDEVELDMQVEKTEGSSKVRRSTRPRKHIKYTANDSEIDGLSGSSDQMDGKCTDGAAVEQELVRDEEMSGDAASGLNEKSGDSYPKHTVCREYLEMGGGFCLDQNEQESDQVQSVVSPTRASDHENIKYLKVGGGFCMDEDEPDTDLIQSVSRPTKDSDENLNELSIDPPTNKGDDDSSNIGVPLEEDQLESQKSESGTRSTTGLTAMPFLRRKQRKA